jgi:hypothetical protein
MFGKFLFSPMDCPSKYAVFHMRNSKNSKTHIWLFLALTGRHGCHYCTLEITDGANEEILIHL